MDPNSMTEEEKKRAMMEAAGKCNFLCLLIFSAAAIGCGLAVTAWCDFLNRDLALASGETPESICGQYDEQSQCLSMIGNHAVGFWAFQGTVPVNGVPEPACYSYTQYITGIGYVTPEFDTKFNSAVAFSVVANFFGLVALFTLCFASCCPLRTNLSSLSCTFFLATLFQGLTLIMFQSNICEVGFFNPYFVGDYNAIPDAVQSVSCSLGTGGKLAIAATVLYFWCMCTVPGAVPPVAAPYVQEQQGRGVEEPHQEDA